MAAKKNNYKIIVRAGQSGEGAIGTDMQWKREWKDSGKEGRKGGRKVSGKEGGIGKGKKGKGGLAKGVGGELN